jgi:hypothetical protein
VKGPGIHEWIGDDDGDDYESELVEAFKKAWGLIEKAGKGLPGTEMAFMMGTMFMCAWVAKAGDEEGEVGLDDLSDLQEYCEWRLDKIIKDGLKDDDDDVGGGLGGIARN